MQILSPAQVLARDAAKATPELPPPPPLLSSLASHVSGCWQAAKTAKEPVEQRIVDCRERRQGVYPAEKLAKIKQLKGAELYLKHSGLKCRAATAWIRDILLSTAERPWGVEPTPIPELPPQVVQDITQTVMNQYLQAVAETGIVPTEQDVYNQAAALRDEAEKAINDEAKQRAEKMEDVIADRFDQGGFYQALDEVVDDLVTCPGGILKGPVVRMVKSMTYGPDGAPMLKIVPEPTDKRVDPLDFYPSPSCTCVDDGYLIERMKLSRQELTTLRDSSSGYDVEAINSVLSQSQGGLVSALSIDSQRQTLEGKTVTTPNVVGDDRVEVLEFWGPVQGQLLLDWGMPPRLVKDPYTDYEVCVVMALRPQVVLKAMINPDPLGRRPYYMTAYEKVSGSCWGNSLVELMAPIQDAMNATMRTAVDNIGFAGGPQVVMDLSRLDKSQHATAATVWPRKVHLVKGGGMPGGGSPVEFYQPQIIVLALIKMLEKLEQLADDHSGIPAYTYGQQNIGGAGETLGGLNMLMQAASKGIRQVIATIGTDILMRRVERQYTYEMLYNEDQSIKGDCRVNARGALAEVIRDQLKAQRSAFVQAMVPPEVIARALGPDGLAALLRRHFSDLEIEGRVPGEQEMTSRLAQAFAAPPQLPANASPDQVGGQTIAS